VIALGLLANLNIGAWRGQASTGWAIHSSLARRYRQREWLGPDYKLTEENVRAGEQALSPRISAQQAVFVFGRVVDERWGSIRLGEGEVAAGESGDVPAAPLIFVSGKLKEALNQTWRELYGFSEDSLFPDFDGFAQATPSTSRSPGLPARGLIGQTPPVRRPAAVPPVRRPPSVGLAGDRLFETPGGTEPSDRLDVDDDRDAAAVRVLAALSLDHSLVDDVIGGGVEMRQSVEREKGGPRGVMAAVVEDRDLRIVGDRGDHAALGLA
jgi:hypothetical protein